MSGVETNFASWCQEEVSKLLGIPVGEEMIKYVLSFENAREIQEHFSSLLDVSDPDCQKFVEDFFKRWVPPVQTSNRSQLYRKADSDKRALFDGKSAKGKKKDNLACDVAVGRLKDGRRRAGNEGDAACEEGGSAGNAPRTMTVATFGADAFLDKNRIMPEEVHVPAAPFRKKNLRYVPLYSQDGKVKTDTIILPGRHPCQCLAQKHKLINNCLECGRIVCEQEGAGPCMFCGNLVCTPEDQEIISRESKKGKKLLEKLWTQTAQGEIEEREAEGLTRAIAHKDKLLEYDRNSVRRTKVYDDEADYFSTDSRWLTDSQRKALQKRDDELREKRHASRLDRNFTLDFAGRRLVEDDEGRNMYDPDDVVVQEVAHNLSGGNRTIMDGEAGGRLLVDPRITIAAPVFQNEPLLPCQAHLVNLKSSSMDFRAALKLQDRELREMVDPGMCLSMHQPWASLLVHGIKKVEGRSWYTAHRGRLWIASTAKQVDADAVREVENMYRQLKSDGELVFPKDYPAGVLLGCVNVLDCVSREEFSIRFPEGCDESDSKFLFVCENAQQLVLKLPMKGQHKIYKLDIHLHAAAKKSLKYN